MENVTKISRRIKRIFRTPLLYTMMPNPNMAPSTSGAIKTMEYKARALSYTVC